MCLRDTHGIVYAHSSTIKAGDRVRVDAGFTCMKEGSVKVVRSTINRRSLGAAANCPFETLYVECGDGRHMLDGQLSWDGDGALIGLYPA